MSCARYTHNIENTVVRVGITTAIRTSMTTTQENAVFAVFAAVSTALVALVTMMGVLS